MNAILIGGGGGGGSGSSAYTQAVGDYTIATNGGGGGGTGAGICLNIPLTVGTNITAATVGAGGIGGAAVTASLNTASSGYSGTYGGATSFAGFSADGGGHGQAASGSYSPLTAGTTQSGLGGTSGSCTGSRAIPSISYVNPPTFGSFVEALGANILSGSSVSGGSTGTLLSSPGASGTNLTLSMGAWGVSNAGYSATTTVGVWNLPLPSAFGHSLVRSGGGTSGSASGYFNNSGIPVVSGTQNTAGINGTDSTQYGGGGGGGGGSCNTTGARPSGRGGNGGNGLIILWW